MIVRVHGDEKGETRLTKLELPSGGLRDIVATSMNLLSWTERLPTHGLEPSPHRALVIILRGAMAIGASDGTNEWIGSGDCLWEDDYGTKGHTFEDVGDEMLTLVSVGIPEDYDFPL